MQKVSIRYILDLIKKGVLPTPEGHVDIEEEGRKKVLRNKGKRYAGCQSCGR